LAPPSSPPHGDVKHISRPTQVYPTQVFRDRFALPRTIRSAT
jgi:hypothetical protein